MPLAVGGALVIILLRLDLSTLLRAGGRKLFSTQPFFRFCFFVLLATIFCFVSCGLGPNVFCSRRSSLSRSPRLYVRAAAYAPVSEMQQNRSQVIQQVLSREPCAWPEAWGTRGTEQVPKAARIQNPLLGGWIRARALRYNRPYRKGGLVRKLYPRRYRRPLATPFSSVPAYSRRAIPSPSRRCRRRVCLSTLLNSQRLERS